MSDGIGDVKPHMRFVEACDIVKIAAYVSRRPVKRVEMKRTDLRQRLGQKILLKPRSQTQFLVQPVHVKMQGFIPPIEEIDFLAKALQLGLELLNPRHRLIRFRCRGNIFG